MDLPYVDFFDLQGYIMLSFSISKGDIFLLMAMLFPVFLSFMIGLFIETRPRSVPS